MAVTYRARDTVLNSDGRSQSDRPIGRRKIPACARVSSAKRAPLRKFTIRMSRKSVTTENKMASVSMSWNWSREKRSKRAVRREGPMPLSLALEITEQAARALAAAEACGVVHRDIKPSNIMLESDASGALVVKVIDYGVAKVLAPQAGAGAEQTQAGFIGTPAFASPEQFAENGKSRIDTRSDIYSLGVTLWFLLCGRTPFVGRTLEEVAARQAEELPLEQLKNAHVPARVIALLQSMLAVDPAKRPQTARELLSAIHRCYTKFSTEARFTPEAICPSRSRSDASSRRRSQSAPGSTNARNLPLRSNARSRFCHSKT